ncbi:MAG: hypothetical protein AAFY15_06260, partial [Cyanobacteria bacterium J06648_11]
MGSVLESPFTKMSQLSLSSWRDERLPEVLWAAILVAQLERDEYLQIFREISEACKQLESEEWQGLGHTNIAKLGESDFDRLVQPIIDRDLARLLTPLSLFPDIPDAHHWKRHVPDWTEANAEDYQTVAVAIGLTSWHQSEQATDVRWLRVLSMIIGGKMHFAESMKSHAEEIIGFPHVGEMRSVR